ncbi:DNA polymerase II [Shewanella maritima]|uniref:DNA polymerase n=1 Tax=Shewanella maritima TaxID=2520507 RepID=A0A411PKU0_9GAMM|nr:DNA polymerase II [Shewanella maritima]
MLYIITVKWLAKKQYLLRKLVSPVSSSASETILGIVLTRHAVTEQGQLVLHYYLQTDNGPVRVSLLGQEVVSFCERKNVDALIKAGAKFRYQEVVLKNFSHQPVCAIYCKSTQQHRMLIKLANDLGVSLFEADIKPENRFLFERFIALEAQFKGVYQSENEFIATHARMPNQLSTAASQLKMVSLDLECSMQGELYSVGLYGQSEAGQINLVIMVGKPDLEVDNIKVDAQSLEIVWVEDEYSLLQALIQWFADFDPDIIIGWAVVVFDLALLSKRCALYQLPLRIGRNQTLMSWKVEDKYRPETLNLPGRVVLDGIDWLKAAFYQFDSFSLEFVSQALLEEGKDIDHVDNRGHEITRLFHQDKQALARYNITDCRLVWDIFVKTELLEFALERAKLTGLEFGRVGASVAAFNNLYLPHLHRAGYVAPAFPASQGLESPGGYVMDSIPGYYNNVLVLDFKSLYPSIIRTFLIDPKGLIEAQAFTEVELSDVSKAIPGFLNASFNRKQPILPDLIANLAAKRETAKRDNNAPLSQAIKIIMNSLYGVLGSTGCVFHDAKLASSITMRGHQIMKLTKQWIEELGYKVIYGDTDSTFVWVEQQLTDEQVKQVGRTLAEQMTNKWRQWCQEQYQLDSFLELEFESHFQQFIMPTLRGSDEGSKKRYVGAKQVAGDLDIVFKGMEQVRSDWSPLAKKVQLALYTRFFKQQDVIEYLRQIVAQVRAGEFSEDLIFKKRLRRNAEDYTAKSSPHVKAALILAEEKKDVKYSRKGRMIKYVMTLHGAYPVQLDPENVDAEYYIERQIKPIAEPILALLGQNFEDLLSNQMMLI